ncbi:MAG: hypothetical protein ACJA2S_002453 [Cyclobacteriaceae bacterium]|jgi:hypothetical protein
MKILKYTLSFLFATFLAACTTNNDIFEVVENISAPSNINAIFSISQDNTGMVTITPIGDGAISFDVFFGDSSGEHEVVVVGETLSRIYAEGNYDVRIVGQSLSGETAEAIQPLVVSFRPPENLEVTIGVDATNNFLVNVSASADFATFFDVYFGDATNEVPTPLMIDETISHVYDEVGDYVIRVVALSGGTATTEYSETITILNPLLLPLDFEDPTLNYAFTDFGNVVSSVVVNPDQSGVNTSATVGQTLKPVGAEVWGGTFLSLDEPIDFSSLQNVAVKVWSPVSGIVVRLKLENATDPDIFAEVDAVNSVASGWETLTFDFSGADLTQEYHKVVLFFDFGNVGNDTTYYFDDINLAQSIGGTFEMFQNFEGVAPIFTDFGGIGATEVVPNPMVGGLNSTNNAAQFTKATGSEVWGGTFFELSDQVIEFAGSKQIRIKSYSPAAGLVVKLKLENADASITHEVDMMTSAVNSWEQITFDFVDAPSAQYNRVVIFYDFGNPGDDAVYYFDEMEVGEGGLVSTVAPLLIEDFEGTAPVFTAFGNIDDTTIEANPNMSGINPTALAASQIKTAGSEVWAGTFFEVTTPLDLNSYSKISTKVYSPTAGSLVKLKLENADASIVFEVDITSSITNDWEELVYDFSAAPAADYTRIVFFFDFGNPGDGTTYYIDEFQLTN